MSKQYSWLFLAFFCFALASNQPFLFSYDDENAPESYERNPYVSEEIWNVLLPYFLPADSPEKKALDKIFRKRRVLSSTGSMRKAGFLVLTDQNYSILVAKHPKLRGYLIKAYLDDVDVDEWFWWKKRIDGARTIQESINRHGYQGIMKTPLKWIYPLPADPSPKRGDLRRNFILVVQELDILDDHKNRKAYKKCMRPRLLDALFTMLMENLLIDSIYAKNIPFCKDGRIAFIDTEHTMDATRPVRVENIAQYLSSDMYDYWEQLVVHGGPH